MKSIRYFAGIAGLSLLLFGCVSSGELRKVENQYELDTTAQKKIIDEQAQHIALLESEKAQYAAQADDLNSKLELLNDRYRALQELSSKTRQNLGEFQKENPEDVHINKEGQLVIAGKLLFQSGSAELSPRGERALDQLNEIVLKKGTYYLRIAGYTDSDPIKHTRGRWSTGLNHELGAYRALNVLAYLIKKGYVNPKYTMIESYGEYQPIAPNDTRKDKSKNRRVGISLQELVEKGAESPSSTPPSENPKPEK